MYVMLGGHDCLELGVLSVASTACREPERSKPSKPTAFLRPFFFFLQCRLRAAPCAERRQPPPSGPSCPTICMETFS